ncbi:MAG: exosortase/archaeosortase family protein [Dysgonamonadaceae bacterium]|nr:exosortase/archaeosortase family protein [Dysgonamonadaceae bacterium]
MYFLGKDVTPAWFHTAQEGLTTITAWFVRLLPSCRDLIQDSIVLYFPDPRITIKIVWGCLGVKQMSIFACVMLFYPGPFLKKLWYIPMGCVILTAYNVVRIGVSVIMTRNNPELFDSLHDGVLRYIYYTILFILWAVWAEYAEKRSDGK